MRSATKEERKSVDLYIKSISHKTGIMYAAGNVDYKVDFKLDDLDYYVEHPKSDMSNVYKIRINGKVYLAADNVLEIIDRSTAYAKELDETLADKADGMMAATSAIRKAVLVLKGGGQG